jgi:hypothetical protein
MLYSERKIPPLTTQAKHNETAVPHTPFIMEADDAFGNIVQVLIADALLVLGLLDPFTGCDRSCPFSFTGFTFTLFFLPARLETWNTISFAFRFTSPALLLVTVCNILESQGNCKTKTVQIVKSHASL